MGRSIRTEQRSRLSRTSRTHSRARLLPTRGATAAIVVVAVLLGLEVVRLTLAGEFAETRPQLAQRLAPNHPDVLVSSAMAQVGEAAATGNPPPPTAIEQLRQLARVSPLRPEPFLVEGAIAQREGDSNRSELLLLQARRLDPRSAAARYLLADAWLREGRIVDGLTEMAILSRLLPGSAGQLVPALAEYVRTPGASDRIKKILAANPRLKRPLLGALASNPDHLELILELEGSVGSSGEERTPPWQTRLLNSLIREGQYDRAYGLWQRLTGFSGPRPLLFNGGFRSVAAPPPFNWRFSSGGAGFAEPGDGSMRILYYGRQNATLASQLLLLPPGTYRLSVALTGTPGPGALAWTVSCVPGGERLTELVLGPPPSAQVSFEVPSSNCPAQTLELRGRSQDMPKESDLQVGPIAIERVAS